MMERVYRLLSVIAALWLTWVAPAGANSVTDWSKIAEDAVTLSPQAGGAGKAPAPSTICN
jgi:hypothetical protein